MADRQLVTDTYGRQKLFRSKSRSSSGFIKLLYCSRALEWLNLHKLLHELLVFVQFSHISVVVDNLTFAWSYIPNLASELYRPSEVFKKFSFANLLDENGQCACQSFKRFRPFGDPLTILEDSSFCKSSLHVRSTDLSIVQHLGLREALAQGLNHIPLKSTKIVEAMAVAMSAFEQTVNIFCSHDSLFPVDQAREWFHLKCLTQLKNACKANKFGFQQLGQFLLDMPAVKNEISWLLKYMYCSGLDKADNNACFICIKHIRLQALERLMSPDFEACKSNETWCLPTAILDQVSSELRTILPECPPPFQTLPYLMATFKQHKTKYRWLTNAFQTIFSSIATLLTLTSAEILETYKSWANSLEIGYKNFLKVDTSMFWLIDSAVDAILNFLDRIFDIFVADITRCYESIPLQGEDNLLEAIQFIINKAFRR